MREQGEVNDVRSADAIWRIEDDRFLEHEPPGTHAERPERLAAVRRGFEAAAATGIQFCELPARGVDDATLLLGHTPRHLERVAAAVRTGASLDEDTYTGPRSEEVARLAVGATIDLCRAVLGPEGPRVGFAAVRPPGHHAERDRAMGFCLYSSAALAALELRQAGLVERIVVLDWDVHHGNGTENVLWEESGLFYLSLHQHPLYPGTGALSDIGAGDGRGWNLNLPMPAGTGDTEVVALFDGAVLPVLEAVEPQLILISAGFDAHARDPLAGLRLTGEGFGWMTERLTRLGCPLAAVLEGGYDLVGLAEGVESMLSAMVGRSRPRRELSPPAAWAMELSERARSILSPCWPGIAG